MRIRISLIILFILFLSFQSWSNDYPQRYKDACEAYMSGHINQATQGFEQLLNEGYNSFELYANLGHCYLQSKKLPEARLYYEKAMRLNPHSHSVQHNIEEIKDELGIDIYPIEDFILVRLINSMALIFSPLMWMLIQFIFAAASIFYLVKWRLGTELENKRRYFYMTTAFLLCFIISLSLGSVSDGIRNDNSAFILMSESVLYASADVRSEELRALLPGTYLVCQDSLSDWAQVVLSNKEIGWVQTKDLVQI